MNDGAAELVVAEAVDGVVKGEKADTEHVEATRAKRSVLTAKLFILGVKSM